MRILKKFKNHAAMATGDFASICKSITIPPLPAATSRLLAEFKRPEPNLPRIARLISVDVEMSSQVLRTVNSAYYGLPNPVSNVQTAASLLGLNTLRSMVMSYAVKGSIPIPRTELFDQDGFWSDCLTRALIASAYTRRHSPGESEDAFTTMLMADIALPVLLTGWEQYYRPVVEEWQTGERRLSEIERDAFGWDHAQAGAWILRSWDFQDELVCLVGFHNVDDDMLAELNLEDTLAVPIGIAARFPSVLREVDEKAAGFLNASRAFFNSDAALASALAEVRERYQEYSQLLGIPDDRAMDRIAEFESVLNVPED